MRTIRLGLLLVSLLASGGALTAQIVWNFGTASGNAAASSGVPAHLAASVVSQNNNFGTTTLLSSSSPSGSYAGASGQFNAAASAISGGFNLNSSTYFQFTLTPDSGHQVSLTSISFGTRSTASGATSVAVYSSDDSFGSSLVTGSSLSGSWSLVSSGTLSSVTGTAATPLTVRIYGYGGSGALGSPNWRIDDLSANVSVTAIPEASTCAVLLGVAALAGASIRRRRLQAAAAPR
jgi:hypothetical protein